ncbi:hypothetical protein H6F95_05370 [Cyanobacteria bacterium FACHB-471]|nr:hypothetical protein [Cyanobacteria bacterium FACHB-471]
MSGPNQHYIPKSVLKSFGIRDGSKGKKVKEVWIFKPGCAPCETLIKKAAAEDFFYSEPSVDGLETLDDRITKYESNHFGHLLFSLRKQDIGAVVDPTQAAEIITHLTCRNAYIRDFVSVGADEVITGLDEFVSNQQSLQAFFSHPKFQEMVDERFAEQFSRWQVDLPDFVRCQIAMTLWKENFNRFYTETIPLFASGLKSLAGRKQELIQSSHNKALTASFTPEERLKTLGRFSWHICSAPKGGAILPDCVALGMAQDNSVLQPYLMTSADKLRIVIFPINPDKLLIGCKDSFDLPDLRSFNEAAAACSHTFFVSAYRTPDLENLAQRIGELSYQTISNAVTEALNDYRTDPQMNQAGLQAAQVQSEQEAQEAEAEAYGAVIFSNPQPFNFSISFVDCADQDTANVIGSAIKGIVTELNRWMPLNRLDGITLAADYEHALQKLDRGVPTVRILTSVNENYGVGWLMPVLVVRNDVIKIHIVARSGLGHSLISEVEAERSLAIHVLVFGLSHAANVSLFEQALPGVHLTEDFYESILYPYAGAAWSGYFASRWSASFAPDLIKNDRDILISVLERMLRDIPQVRLTYRIDNDLDRLLSFALSSTGDVLRYAAYLLGHCDDLDRSPYDDDGRLAATLENAGLTGWLAIFQTDLQKIWGNQGRWTSFQEFLTLNRHLERLLWQSGIFPYKTPEGGMYVSVPLVTDGLLSVPPSNE